MAKFLCHATVHTNFLEKKTLKEKKRRWVEVGRDGWRWRWVEVGGGGWRWVKAGGGGWRWVEVGGGGWRWVEVGGGGWRWVEVGVQFSNSRFLYYRSTLATR